MTVKKAMLCVWGLTLMLLGCSAATEAPNPSVSTLEQSAINVVSARNAAYNAHDLEAFLGTYDEKVRIYTFPDELMGEGVDRLRRIFGGQFSEKDGKIRVHSLHAVDNIVVSDATESFFGIEQHVIAIYTIRNGLITDLRLIEPAKEE